MTIDDFDALLDEAERFHGDEIDENKLNKLNAMRTKCAEIASFERNIRHEFDPFSDRDANAVVKLSADGPMCFFDDRSIRNMAELFSMADDAAINVNQETGALQVVFGIREMWSRYHYEEHEK